MPPSRVRSVSRSGGAAKGRAAQSGSRAAARSSGAGKGSSAAVAHDAPPTKRAASEDRQARKMLDEIKIRGDALSARIDALLERLA